MTTACFCQPPGSGTRAGRQYPETFVFIHLTFFFPPGILFTYERHRERERQRHRQREKQAPRREPNAGLDPRTPGSRPGPKAGAKPLSHLGIPTSNFSMLGMLLGRQIHLDSGSRRNFVNMYPEPSEHTF